MSLAVLSPLAITAAELCTQPYTQSLLGNVLSMFCSAGPVASFTGLWHDAQLDMKRAFPSGAAIAGTLHKSKRIKKAKTLREQILYSGINDSGTRIYLKINLPLCKAWAKLQHNPENIHTFCKKFFSILARVSAVFLL